jgi:hypothetical protein
MLAVLGFNAIGDAIRDIVEARLSQAVEAEPPKSIAQRRSNHG